MKEPRTIPTVKLVEEDGNAFTVMGKVSSVLKRAGADKEYVQKYLDESMSGDYDHLLGVAMEYVNVV